MSGSRDGRRFRHRDKVTVKAALIGLEDWPGRVSRLNRDGTYNVLNCNTGGFAYNVPESMLEPRTEDGS